MDSTFIGELEGPRYSTNLLVIESPNPTPCLFLPFSPSYVLNGINRRSFTSYDIPSPVSSI
jgi:hypothetical protein